MEDPIRDSISVPLLPLSEDASRQDRAVGRRRDGTYHKNGSGFSEGLPELFKFHFRLSRRTVLYVVLAALTISLIVAGHDAEGREAAIGYAQSWVPPSAADKALAAQVAALKNTLEANFHVDVFHTGRLQNGPALDRLADCLTRNVCKKQERKVVVLATSHFGNALAGSSSGEDIWAHSTIEVLADLNYTTLYSYSEMEALAIYQAIPDMVQVIIAEGSAIKRCVARNETNYLDMPEVETGAWQTGQKGCVKKEGFEHGIPIWKMFAFHFWLGPASPLGLKWTLNPENYQEGGFYLGYSIESRCSRIDFQNLRYHRGMILGKRLEYFEPPKNLFAGMFKNVASSVPPDVDTITGKQTKFKFVATAGHSAEDGTEILPEPGVVSLGSKDQHEWWDILAKSKVLVGIGLPAVSPSPYDALCFGVPFINPITHYDPQQPNNRSRWQTQHFGLRYVDEPWVYHVRAGNKTELNQAVQDAVANPIDRYIPAPMRRDALRDRHHRLLEHDWSSEAAAIISERWPANDAPFLL